jgi:hypothetical protein
METKAIYVRGTRFVVKRNIHKCPILNISYIWSYKKDKRSVCTCVIDWYDPIVDRPRITIASTVCNPNDKPNHKFAKKFAESRCKYSLYSTYRKELEDLIGDLIIKQCIMIRTELEHQQKLINEL